MRRALPGLLAIAAVACDGPPVDTYQPTTTVAERGVSAATSQPTPPEPMTGFSWVVPGSLAAMPRPGARRDLADDLAFLRAESVDVLVSLTEHTLDADALAAAGLDTLHLPVRDFTPPTLQQMQTFSAKLDAWTAAGKRVGVHCTAGLGRTGTLMAASFVHRGMTAAAAIAQIRRLRPGSIETRAQEDAVHEYYAFVQRDAGDALDRRH